jgi:hypothetical protein
MVQLCSKSCCTEFVVCELVLYNCGHGILAVTFMSFKKIDVVHALLSLYRVLGKCPAKL